MRFLGIAGSLRKGSYNRQLAEAARAVMAQRHPDVEFELLEWADVPFMNQDIEHPAGASFAPNPILSPASVPPCAAQTACGSSVPSTTTLFPGR